MLLFALLSGCNAPPVAPDELDALLGFLWLAAENDDRDAVEVGVAALAEQLEGIQASDDLALRSAQLSPLPAELPVPRVDGRDGSDELAVAVWTASAFPIAAHADLQDTDDLTPLDASAEMWERDVVAGSWLCVAEGECDEVRTQNLITRASPVHRWTIDQPRTFQWIPSPSGSALLGVAHTTTDVPSSVGDAHLYSQHELEVWWPQGSGTARLAATWSDASYGPLSDDAVLSALTKAAEDVNVTVEELLTAPE